MERSPNCPFSNSPQSQFIRNATGIRIAYESSMCHTSSSSEHHPAPYLIRGQSPSGKYKNSVESLPMDTTTRKLIVNLAFLSSTCLGKSWTSPITPIVTNKTTRQDNEDSAVRGLAGQMSIMLMEWNGKRLNTSKPLDMMTFKTLSFREQKKQLLLCTEHRALW